MKKIEKEALQTLKGEVVFLLNQADDFDKKLARNIAHISRHEHLVTAAYHLSCIYSCLEDAFGKIARTFENRIENPASWHKELLERMRISVPRIRSAVVSGEVFEFLNDMRGFRHVFRGSYVFNLDRERVTALAQKWDHNKGAVLKEIRNFLDNI